MRRLRVHATSGLWIGITAASLLLPADPDLGDHFRWLPVPVDKAAHFLLFSVCAFLLHRSCALELDRWSLGVAAGLALAYGLATELLQSLVPTRGFDPIDMVANTVGVAVYVGWALRSKAAREPRKEESV